MLGFLTGFGNRLHEIRHDEARENEIRASRDQRVLEMLANSDDPEIRTLATTAMLIGPSKKQNIFGAAEGHPMLGAIAKLIGTPVRETKTRPGPGLVGPGPGTGVLPQHSPVEPSGPQMHSEVLTSPGESGVAPGVDSSLAGAPGAPQMHTLTGVSQDALPTHSLASLLPQSHQETTSHPREVFMDPSKRAGLNTEAQIGGRIKGLIGGAQQAGVNLSDDDQTAIVRGIAGAPARIIPPKALTLELSDGTTVGGFANGDGTFSGPSGELLDNVVRIVPTTSTNVGAFSARVQDRTSRTGWSLVRKDAAGNITSVTKDVAAPTDPTMFQTVIPTSEGTYGITRGGQVRTIPLPPPGASPEAYSTRLLALSGAMDSEFESHKTKLGSLTLFDQEREYNPQNIQQLRDQIAQKYGFANYAAFQTELAQATRAVGGRVPPGTGGRGGTQTPAPAAPVSPQATDPNDPDGLRRYLPRPGGR